ncbi:MAG: hypothetical protein NTX43_13145 [Bacteroidetes bacterium]|nr:hypothetical protein [Bacteroidota bacterium]
MKTINLNPWFLLLAVTGLFAAIVAFKTPAQQSSKLVYMQFSTIESIIPGGLGRSKMITVMPDGTKTEEDLQNFYSMVGINFGNISGNNIAITKKINNLVAQGWEFDKVMTGTQSPSDNNGQGIFISRYFFKRAAE